MANPEHDELGAKLTAAARKINESPDFAARIKSDPQLALAELNFTAQEASKFRLEPTEHYSDSCICISTVGRGCLVVDAPGTFG